MQQLQHSKWTSLSPQVPSPAERIAFLSENLTMLGVTKTVKILIKQISIITDFFHNFINEVVSRNSKTYWWVGNCTSYKALISCTGAFEYFYIKYLISEYRNEYIQKVRKN